MENEVSKQEIFDYMFLLMCFGPIILFFTLCGCSTAIFSVLYNVFGYKPGFTEHQGMAVICAISVGLPFLANVAIAVAMIRDRA